MNVLILGASGRVGRKLVQYALKDGYDVKAFVRNPEKLHAFHEKLTIFQGDARSREDIFNAIKNVDAVISTLSTDKTTTLTDSIPLVIEAMKQENISRIITVGTAGILNSRTNPELLRYQSSESKRKLTRAAEEHEKVFRLLEQSQLDWTIVCPTYLPDGDYTGTYRVEQNRLPEAGKEISVADTAEFTYHQLNSDKFLRTRVGICY
ncbi:NAD(P)-dependent oxidoreductase [Bacillus taeanensis]|uniref:NAD(P)-binding domain-containing protein n=1 Tax=Bacillus taeanensis TaxID=273032 RepID=A0A366XY41_9BACI|nr:SDR family oxidoreductase [Bacillus taeanensis]RBW69074.1 hypothetical protein DS031_13015 [Bacillus taeanensis]